MPDPAQMWCREFEISVAEYCTHQCRVDVSARQPQYRKRSLQILKDQYLSIASRARANADRRNWKAGADITGEVCRHALEHNRESAKLFKSSRLTDDILPRRKSDSESSGLRKGYLPTARSQYIPLRATYAVTGPTERWAPAQ
jgi:hypothetical protein